MVWLSMRPKLLITATVEARLGFYAVRVLFLPRKMVSWRMVPCVIFEDEHLLVVSKPAGWNTHAPSPFAGEGIYDWLRHREPRWSSLAILHRLDKETSGVLVFGKTPLANKSLTEQFTARRVHKKYLLLTDRAVPQKEFTVKTALVRTGEKYASRPGGEMAETKFTPVADAKFEVKSAGLKMVSAEPFTGRTHQIRVHAAESGFPILGDTLYGGTPSSRVFLHAAEIAFTHPATNEPVKFSAPVNFDLRAAPRPAPGRHRAGRDERLPPHSRRERRLARLVRGEARRFFALAIRIAVEREAARRIVVARQKVFFARRVSQNSFAPSSPLHNRPKPRRNLFLAKLRRSGLRFWRTASVSR